ncbi:MAG: hypothetical protein KME18_28000 [Phormidium tanganyikae FI6-MK23]|jgi:hypothetical protein|nr:hypothetical protein [Phormidium tanganyikae FI6-MK23]
MKFKLFGSTAVLALAIAITPQVQAETSLSASRNSEGIAQAPTASGATTTSSSQASAFHLTFLARDGYLEAQGIPSGNLLSYQVAAGQITVEDIVKAGIQANRVSPDALNDQAYLSAVEYNLQFNLPQSSDRN